MALKIRKKILQNDVMLFKGAAVGESCLYQITLKSIRENVV
jgi:hypothetical protein